MLETREIFATIASDWTIPDDLPYFDGHFPGRPIFPAVGIVDATLAFLRSCTDDPSLELTRITSAKFSHPMGPGQKVRIVAERLQGGEWRLEWCDPSPGDRMLASLRLQVESSK